MLHYFCKSLKKDSKNQATLSFITIIAINNKVHIIGKSNKKSILLFSFQIFDLVFFNFHFSFY